MTVLGIVTLVRLLQKQKASNPMLMTGRPLIVSGMVTAPPGPVYLVMVIVPLVIMQLNWASTTAGSANNNSSGSRGVVQAVLKRPAKVFGCVIGAM